MVSTDPIRLFLRRATFGFRPGELEAARSAGLAAAVATRVHPTGPDPAAAATPPPTIGPNGRYSLPPGATPAQRKQAGAALRSAQDALVLWWLDRMTVAEDQLAEKMVFFWHGHWATSIDKVKDAGLMLA